MFILLGEPLGKCPLDPPEQSFPDRRPIFFEVATGFIITVAVIAIATIVPAIISAVYSNVVQ
jgi:hypothetical protein